MPRPLRGAPCPSTGAPGGYTPATRDGAEARSSLLTPAEALGLQGLRLASRVRRAFYRIPASELSGLLGRIEAAAAERHLVYARDGEIEAVRLLPSPLAVLPDQLAYVHFVSVTVQNALKRLPEIYAA